MPDEPSMTATKFNRMATELREDMEKMKSAEQMQFIREIAAGLAHEIINPITGIKGALEIFHRELNLSEEDRAVFEEMLFQIRKLDVMTKSFLEYARPRSTPFLPSDINEIIQNTLLFITRYSLHKNIHKVAVVKEMDGSIPVMNIDPLQLQQVFLNLILYVLDIMSAGEALTFRTAHTNDSVIVEVSHAPNKASTDAARQSPLTGSRGFGVGLSVSKRVIEQLGGEMVIEKGERGTVFLLVFPVTLTVESLG